MAAVLGGTLVAACGAPAGVTTREASPIVEETVATAPAEQRQPDVSGDFEIEWESESADVSEGSLEVPVDYRDPDGPTFTLHLVRNKADDPSKRIGSLLVNPGGPGFGGSEYAMFAESVYGEELLAAFDIIGWDPRGTGKSTPALDCVDDYDKYYAEFDITPDDEAERQVLVDTAEEFAAGCVERSGDILAFVGTNDSARDMEAMRIELDEAPLPTEPDRPEANRVVAIGATIAAMYSSSRWPELAQALADAQDGDGAGLLALFDSYYQRLPDGTWGDELEAFQSIVCMDSPDRTTVEQEDAGQPEFNKVAPRLSPGSAGDYFCTFFPESSDPRIEVSGAGAGPIVVIGTTGDPATPLSGTRTAADVLEEGTLVIVDANEHTGYSVSPCAQDFVHAYLVELEVPADGTECD
ncbi:MAG: alpha/beta hydrolase [Actinomycetota bacterium]|nr:alpha/beta hydrolase [Actinomycetota bacterium]